MPQIITKLSERRALKNAAKHKQKTIHFCRTPDPEAIAQFEANVAENFPGASPTEIAEHLVRQHAAEAKGTRARLELMAWRLRTK